MAFDLATLSRAWRAHYLFQGSLYGGGQKTIAGGEVCFSPWLADPEWNHAVIEGVALDELPSWLDEASRLLRQVSRQTTVVISPQARSRGLGHHLAAAGWRKSFAHSWLFYTGTRTPACETGAVRIAEAQDEAAMAAFVRVFYAAFSSPEEKLASGYGEALMASWRKRRQGPCKLVHYLATINGEPVGIGTRVQAAGVAGFYNLGVVPERRRHGVGAALSNRRLRDARKAGAELIFLQTEEDAVKRWQLAQGWQWAFTAVGWTPRDP